MGVTAAARRLDGGLIKLESTHDNLCTIFRIGDIYHQIPRTRGTFFQYLTKQDFKELKFFVTLIYLNALKKAFRQK